MRKAEVRFVDVGQGDCVIAVDSETGEGLMMDCPAGGEERALAALDELKVSRLRVAIASHEHLDHLGGVYGVVTAVPTEKVKVNAPVTIPQDLTERKKLRAAVRAIQGLPRKGVTLETALAGESGTAGRLHWRIMAPDNAQQLAASASSNPNHGSVVLRISHGPASVIASSDADGGSWDAMATRGEALSAEVLQIPHHGGEFSAGGTQWTLSRVLDQANAAYHVVSVGSANTYGHPSESTLATVQSERPASRLLCTQLNPICAGCTLQAGTRCAGSITFGLDRNWELVEPSASDHAQYVATLPSPQCIP
jgi:competence protein ComEC